MKNKNFTLTITIIALLFVSACSVNFQEEKNTTKTIEKLDLSSDELLKFDNVDELETYLKEISDNTQNQNVYYNVRSLSSSLSKTSMAMDSIAETAPRMEGDGGASDYSTTNVQVEGVDEADFVKNDDKYIYMVANGNLIIIDAYNGKNAKIISEIKIGNGNYDSPRPVELFVYNDKLALFVESNEQSYSFAKYDIRPMPNYRQNTEVYLYDISNREKPIQLETIKSSGSYYQSRMIGDKIYLVTIEGTGYGYINEPIIYSGSLKIMPNIYYFPNPEQNYQFNTITSIDIDTDEVVDTKTFMLGYSNTLMMSEDNIYIAYQKNNYWGWYREPDRERFFDVVVPLLQGELKTDVQNIVSQNYDEDKEWEEIEIVLGNFFTKLENDKQMQAEYEDMLQKISDAVDEYDLKKQLENSKTIIHKLSVDKGVIDYVAKGEVNGQLLNQFSMDEHNENLRVATTISIWTRERVQYNNVYVLDKDMNEIGSVEKIAEDERIYSTRFIGDKLFMVTFAQTDPFFVIDLSEPTNPKVLGELKLPGFSNYLHPISDTLILGVGKETTEEKWGFKTNGVKIALFDVSDYSNPKLVDKVEIGGSGSDSPILYDHKAFLYAPSKDNLLVIPVREVEEKDDYYGTRRVWNGAYAFKVDEKGFTKIGTVEHSSVKTQYYWYNEASVKRSLYMDNLLYTISDKYLKINDLSNDLEEVNNIELPLQNNNYPYRVDDVRGGEIMVDSVASVPMK